LGNTCGLITNPLPNDWEIPMNNFNFRFQSIPSATNINNVGIGTTCAPIAKLHVEQNSNTTTGSMGIFVENKDFNSCGSGPVIGIKSLVSNINPVNDIKCAGWFESVPSPNCQGSLQNYAIIVPQNGGQVEIGYSPVSLNFGSIVNINGNLNAANYTGPSDVSLKNTVNTLPNSLNKIKSLRPVTYKWNNPNDSMMAGLHAGFIAQEVDTVIPQLVRTETNGLKSLAYIEMIPYLVSAMQELIKQNKQQDSVIQVLTQNVASCCSNSAARQTGITGNNPKALTQINVNLSDVDMIVLNQNVPNPFAEQTTITYNVPEKYGFAQLIFKTLEGKIIKTVDITKKGRGQVNVFANDLSNGLYMYSLIVDGMNVDTKKMVKQN
jgi:Chaperone of endosialidase